MRPPVSVVLIRENAEQVTGSGCCGKLDGDLTVLGADHLFEQSRRQQRDLGVLHRAIRKFFPTKDGQERVRVVVVDPRNQLYLVPKLWRDVWRYRPGFWSGVQTALLCFSLPAVIINGRIESRRGGPFDADSVCHTIGELLRRRE